MPREGRRLTSGALEEVAKGRSCRRCGGGGGAETFSIKGKEQRQAKRVEHKSPR